MCFPWLHLQPCFGSTVKTVKSRPGSNGSSEFLPDCQIRAWTSKEDTEDMGEEEEEATTTTTDKVIFFTELEKLDALTDSQDQDEDDFSRLIALSKRTAAQADSVDALVPTSSSSSAALNTTTARANASIQSSSQSQSVAGPEQEQDEEMARKPALKSAKTTGTIEDKPEGPPVKRRRTYAARTIPEQQQVLKGLVFFFFPNNDVSPLRRLRIQRAQEYGAFWARSWGDNVTHVIVDKGLMYQDILRHLNLDSVPSTVALVDESYPSECIKFRSILNPAQTRFRVNGIPTPSTVKEPSPDAAELSSAESLPLKPPKGQEPNTPTQSDQQPSDQNVPDPTHGEQIDQITRAVQEEVPPRERDALDDLIDEAKTVQDLPLDPLEDETTAPAPEEDSTEASDSEQENQNRQSAQKEDPVVEAWQRNFACMQKHEQNSDSKSPNSRTIEVLQQMLDYYERTQDTWRVIAYRKAINALRRQHEKIVTKKQALSITGVGPRLADKIEEIVFTNRLRRLENTNCTPEDLILQHFLGVYGAGLSQASRWVAQGYRSLEDLKAKAFLNKSQRIGVDHYQDFNQRIPRQEVAAHGAIVQQAVHKADAGMQAIIGGSYRRGAANSGDIDVLITKPGATIGQIRTVMMEVVVPDLFQQGFLQASLASTSRGDGSKWHGASALPDNPIWRRIDLLFVPGSDIGAALIYFTGNDIFNRSMRLLASKKGMRLNQRGLYADVIRGEQRKKLNEGRLLEGRDERRIFELLGVPWRPPEHRIC